MQVMYNVTVSLDPSIEQDWSEWMRSVHIPQVLASGCFLEARMSKLNNEENEGITYAMTYIAFSQAHLDTYQKEHAPLLQKDHTERYQGKFAAFRTTLNIIEHFRYEG